LKNHAKTGTVRPAELAKKDMTSAFTDFTIGKAHKFNIVAPPRASEPDFTITFHDGCVHRNTSTKPKEPSNSQPYTPTTVQPRIRE
jgi:hypothetical protein